jgi:hypothetical protein
MLMLVLACSMSAMSGSSDSSMKHDKMEGKSMSMTGCISEKDGKYMLMNKKHPDGVQLMGSEDMGQHVGHKVKVTGTMEKMDAMGDSKSGDAMKPDDKKMDSGDKMKGDSMGHESMGMMKVNSMKMESSKCDMSKM